MLLLSGFDQLHPEVIDVARIVSHIKDKWLNLARLWLLVYVVNEAALALDASIGYLADLLRIECLPRLVVQVFVKRHYVYRIHEVDKGVADVTAVIKVERQVEKVIIPLMHSVDSLE